MGKFKWVGVYRINVATDINPQEIYAEYKRGLIDRNLAIERITLLIETGKGTYLRAESVEYLGNIKPLGIDIFRLLENFVLSDVSPLVRSTALKKIIQNYSNEGIETLKYVIKSDFSPLVFKTLLLETDAIEGGELSVTIKEDLLDKFETLFGVVREEAKFFLDLYRIFAIENNFFNIEEQWSKDYWPSSVGDIDKQHWIAIKDGHVQALNLNRYKLGEIPPSIHFLHELKHLNIINNRLLDVPNSLFPHVIGIITEKYFREGVEANDDSVLAILELLTTIYKDESSSLKYN